MTGHFYDSIIYYASMVHDLKEQGFDYRNGTILAGFYANYAFHSPINGEVRIQDDGDRLSAYVLQSFDHRKLAHGVKKSL